MTPDQGLHGIVERRVSNAAPPLMRVQCSSCPRMTVSGTPTATPKCSDCRDAYRRRHKRERKEAGL